MSAEIINLRNRIRIEKSKKRINDIRIKFRGYLYHMYYDTLLGPEVVSMLEDAVVVAETVDSTKLYRSAKRIDRLARKSDFMKEEAETNGALVFNIRRFKCELWDPMDGLPAFSSKKNEEITKRKLRAEIAKRLVRKELARKWSYNAGRMEGFDGISEVVDAGNVAHSAIIYDFASPGSETPAGK